MSRRRRPLRVRLGLPRIGLRGWLLAGLAFLGLVYLGVVVVGDLFTKAGSYAPDYYEPKDFQREPGRGMGSR
jgi:hypothetical protein